MSSPLLFWLFTSLLINACSALLEESFVGFNQGNGSVALSQASIIIDTNDFAGVQIAVDSLASDFNAILGHETDIVNYGTASKNGSTSAVIVGSITNSSVIQDLVDTEQIDVSDIEGKWETFLTSVVRNPLPGVDEALVIAGSDKRGTIFGVYTLSEQAGQSPYHWWADVPTKKHDEIYALSKTTTQGPPSVKYRGLFINDEAPALQSWWAARNNVTTAKFDVEFYRHVYDLLLRLKANYIWPAMWAGWPQPGSMFFLDDPLNHKTADEYGIVVSTSHHEPMQRATNEWTISGLGEYDWESNKENVTKFMREGAERAGDLESYFTLGMRGAGDSGLEVDDPIALLKDVFKTQRGIFEDVYGSETAPNQVWAIYKEVATYYAAGLDPPEDVTLLLPDDNYGNVQRLPSAGELGRPGGFGVYFHLEYVGVPRSYKWTNTNGLAKVLKDLSHAYLRGADQMWVINVGDIKPMELPFGFAMDLAWDNSKIDFSTIPEYLLAYASREFGGEDAEEIADILMELNLLLALQRYENVEPSTYSYVNYLEAENIMKRWRDITDKAQTLYDGMPEEYKPAFYQLVYYPVKSGSVFYELQLSLGRNDLYALERRNSANELASTALVHFDEDFDLTEGYDSLLGGKWKNIMRQARYGWTDSWVPPARDMISGLSYVQLRQNTVPALGDVGVVAEGTIPPNPGLWCESCDASKPMEDDFRPTVPLLDPYSPKSRWVDLYMRGDYRVPKPWSVKPEYDWISVSPSKGTLSEDVPDQRLSISVNWDAVPEGFDDIASVEVNSTNGDYEIFSVPVRNIRAPSGFKGYPETDGIMSMEGPHFQDSSFSGDVSLTRIPYLGTRSTSGSLALRPFKDAHESPEDCMSSYVEYKFYLFKTAPLNATLYFNMALDTDPALNLSYSATLDDTEPKFERLVEQPETVGDLPSTWEDAVVNGVWEVAATFGNVTSGEHVLRYSANSPEVYLEKVVLYTSEEVRPSYLGPPETTIL
ncbi:hypothetical protein FQN54_007063 [Arachnomyces sp. PD_36]|nr:hypothetical protein FQN54_007063 [Arachnomyces sp. PD_36]